MEPEWISVKDRLPEINDNPDWVLALTNEDGPLFYHIAQFWGDTWATNSEILYYITHWMPLPEPPKEA